MHSPTRTSVDIIVATRNRALRLRRLLDSLASADLAAPLELRLTVVGNACTDETPRVVEDFARTAPFEVQYLEESTPGKSWALNAGIARTSGDWTVYFDDDEKVFANWFVEFHRVLTTYHPDFLGGRYLSEWEAPPPGWLPSRHASTVLGQHDSAIPRQRLTDRDSLMWGGNCAIARRALNVVGVFSTDWARHDQIRSLGCEDVEMQLRLVRAGFDGWYEPSLQILHWTPNDRLTRGFFREKLYWAGHTARRFEEMDHARTAVAAGPFGVPRWRWRAALTAMFLWVRCLFSGRGADRLAYELDLRMFAGYVSAARTRVSG